MSITHFNIFLAKCITKAKNDYPELKVNILGASNYSSLLQLLQKHIVDFVILDTVPQGSSEIKVETLKEINNVFISKEEINVENIKDLEKYKYILNYENSNSTKELMTVLEKYGVSITADIQADVTEMRIEEVKQGQGIGYVMEEAAQEFIKNNVVQKVKLPINLPKTKINLIYMNQYLTKMDKIFIKEYLRTK